MQGSGEGNNQHSNSEKRSLMPREQVTSENLPRNVSMQLFDLMQKIVEDDVNPKTVHAACACASEIHKILKLNLEMKRAGI